MISIDPNNPIQKKVSTNRLAKNCSNLSTSISTRNLKLVHESCESIPSTRCLMNTSQWNWSHFSSCSILTCYHRSQTISNLWSKALGILASHVEPGPQSHCPIPFADRTMGHLASRTSYTRLYSIFDIYVCELRVLPSSSRQSDDCI